MTLASLAQEAADHWGGTPLAMIRNRENAVFRMQMPDGSLAALRLHREGYQSGAAIASELWWCAALAEAGLPVPSALPARDGGFLIRLSSGRSASVVRWMPGVPYGEAGVPLAGSKSIQTARHFMLGRLVAQIHDATDRLTLPTEFTRPHWDVDGLVGETPFWGRFWEHPALGPDESALLSRARDHLQRVLSDHAAQHPLAPIHADVLRENILVSDENLSLIDFDDSGMGYRLYDLGTALSQDLAEPHYPALRDALIRGYETLRPVDPVMVDAFTLMRTLASVGWTIPRLAPDDPINRRHIDRALRFTRTLLG